METLRIALLYTITFLMAWMPFASHAQLSNSSPALQFVNSETMLEVIGRDQNNEQIRLQIPRGNEEELKKDSPMELAKEFLLKPTITANRRFLPESGLFFVAVGAVTLLQLSRDYSSNPMRTQQHLEHSFSATGAFSLYMYLQASGVSTHILQTISKNKEFYKYIPYLGMTAGYFTQSMLSSFAADPNVQACANLMLNKEVKPSNDISTNPCQSAFSFYVLGHRLLDMTPGLISMLATVAISGQIQKYALKGALMASDKVLKLTGFDVVTFILPGGIQSWGVRLLIAGVQTGIFYQIDNGWLNRKVTFAWKNLFSGLSLRSLEKELSDRVLWKKKTGWAEQLPESFCSRQEPGVDCKRELSEALKAMHDQLGEWRMVNMAETHEAHQHWQTRLNNLTGQFNATFEVYKEIVAEARNSKWKFNAPYRLEMEDPLYGVTAKADSRHPLNPILLYEAPQITQNYASETAKDVGLWLQKKLIEKDLPSFLTPQEIRLLSEIAMSLTSDDIKVQGRGLELIQKNIFPLEVAFSGSSDLRQILTETRKKLGSNAKFINEPGRGFLLRLENYSVVSSQLKTISFPAMKADQTVVQYLLIPAICGPAGNSPQMISSISGFSARFEPPRLTTPTREVLDRVCGAIAEYPAKALFNIDLQQNGKTYKGLLDYVKNNLSPEILGTEDQEGFSRWWENGPQMQMKVAFETYAAEYDSIVRKMYKNLVRKKSSLFNAGPAENNPIDTLRQQVRLDLLIYGEMFKDLFQKQYRFAMPATAFSSETPTALTKNLLANLSGRGPVLKIQSEIEEEFEKLISMILKMDLSVEDGKPRLQNTYENSDFDAQVVLINEKLKKAESFLGGERFERGVIRLENQEQRKILAVSLQGLKDAAMELSIYGGLMNAVSWTKIRRLKETNDEQSFYRTKLEMSLKKLGAGLTIKGVGTN